MEQTLIILKPDSVQRGLVGEIITRFEKAGLKIVAAKMIKPDKTLVNTHYPRNRKEFITGIGDRTSSSYKENGLDVKKQFGTDDKYEIGLIVQSWLADSISSSPVIAMVLEGPDAIRLVRKIRGHTIPIEAEPGTITGDYSFDSPAAANFEKRSVRNLVHASGNKEEADFEINLWFTKEELHAYDTIHQKHMTT